MGCSQSKIENEEVVSRCKDRKLFMTDAVSARNAFAAAHSSYAMSLKNTGAVLSDFAHGGENPNPNPNLSLPSPASVSQSTTSFNSLPPPPPPLPGSPNINPQRATSMFEIKPSKIESKPNVEPIIEEVNENEIEIDCSRRKGKLVEEEDSTYDYLFSHENMPVPAMCGVEGLRFDKEEMERKVNGAVPEKLGEEPPPCMAGKLMKKMKQVMVKGNVNLMEIFMELDDHFLKASENAHEVSKMLEATRLHFHSNFADNRGHIDHSARVMRVITWNRSFRGLPNNNDDLNDDFDSEEHETHATVLDKLLAWEKKLFEEVKAGELMKFEYQKKVATLNKLKKKGSNFEAIEKAKATVSHLHTRYIVDMQSMDSTVSEINRIRDEQLYPKLVQLVIGMATMWENMHFHHASQSKIVTALRLLDISQSPKETSEHHHERTIQLWAVVQEWHSQLEKLVNRQKAYIKALSSWLRLNLIPTESSLKEKVSSPPRVRSPPIHGLLHAWQDHLEKLPDEVLRNVIFTFATMIKTIMQSQEEEVKLRQKCQETERELSRKTRQFRDWEKKYMQRRTSTADEANPEENGEKDIVAEKQALVEAVGKRLEEEREEYQKQCLHVREKSLASLKNQLPELFRALSEFSLASSRMYRYLKSISQQPNRPQNPSMSSTT